MFTNHHKEMNMHLGNDHSVRICFDTEFIENSRTYELINSDG